MSQNIVIIDYGMSNLHSVQSALKQVAPQATITVTADPKQIEQADRIVFPGQGAAKDCMKAMSQFHLNQAILKAAKEKPFLGICMGLQVLLEHSEENGGTNLLGLFAGKVVHFPKNKKEAQGLQIKIPQMGWNQVKQKPHPLWDNIPDQGYFYFVHSYYVQPENPDLAIGLTHYGIEYDSALASDNLFAVQFHPEKSADNGLQLLRNFTQWKP